MITGQVGARSEKATPARLALGLPGLALLSQNKRLCLFCLGVVCGYQPSRK